MSTASYTTTHGHRTAWFVPKAAPAARSPLTPLPLIAKRRARTRVPRARSKANILSNSNLPFWGAHANRQRPRWAWRARPRCAKPAPQRYSVRAPSLRLAQPFSPFDLVSVSYGTNLESGARVVADCDCLDWLDEYGTNTTADSLSALVAMHRSGHHHQQQLEPTAAEGPLDSGIVPFSESSCLWHCSALGEAGSPGGTSLGVRSLIVDHTLRQSLALSADSHQVGLRGTRLGPQPPRTPCMTFDPYSSVALRTGGSWVVGNMRQRACGMRGALPLSAPPSGGTDIRDRSGRRDARHSTGGSSGTLRDGSAQCDGEKRFDPFRRLFMATSRPWQPLVQHRSELHSPDSLER